MLDPNPPTSPDPGTGASRDRRERPKSFGRMRCDAEQGVRQVGGTPDGNQACGDQLSLLIGCKRPDSYAHPTLISPASTSRPVNARTSADGRAFAGLARSSARAQAAATSLFPSRAALASGPQPPRQASTVPRPVLCSQPRQPEWPTPRRIQGLPAHDVGVGNDVRRVEQVRLTAPGQVLDGDAFSDQAACRKLGGVMVIVGQQRKYIRAHRPGAARGPCPAAGRRIGRKGVQQRRAATDERGDRGARDRPAFPAWLSHVTGCGQREPGRHAVDPAIDRRGVGNVQEAIRQCHASSNSPSSVQIIHPPAGHLQPRSQHAHIGRAD